MFRVIPPPEEKKEGMRRSEWTECTYSWGEEEEKEDEKDKQKEEKVANVTVESIFFKYSLVFSGHHSSRLHGGFNSE